MSDEIERQAPGRPETPRVAVIIPHYNDAERLARALHALAEQDRRGVEVVVVDNASPVDLGPLRVEYPWVIWLHQSEPSAGLSRNAGVAGSTAPWLAFLDADCRPASDWLDRVRRIASGPADWVTGGRIEVFDETAPPRSGAEAFETVFAFDQEAYIRDKGFSVTANLVTARAVFERTGPFRAGLSEDLDWCRRATAAGAHLVYDPDLVVGHPTRQTWPALARKWRRLTAEEYQLGGSRLRWLLKALAMPGSAVAHLPRVLGAGALDDTEKARALVTLVRLRVARMIWMLRLLATRRPG